MKREIFGDRWEIGKWVFLGFCLIGVLAFVNRYDLIFINEEIGLRENVKYLQSGALQLVRSLLEHISFNFTIPLVFVIVSLGFDKLFNQKVTWKIAFSIGALCCIFATIAWEWQHKPIEVIEIGYDLAAIGGSFLFTQKMLMENRL